MARLGGDVDDGARLRFNSGHAVPVARNSGRGIKRRLPAVRCHITEKFNAMPEGKEKEILAGALKKLGLL